MDKNCVNCGAKLPEGAKFCPACAALNAEPGAILPEVQAAHRIQAKYIKRARKAAP